MSLPIIIVIGSLNTDLVTRTPGFPKPGETVTSSSFSTGCGGKGANQAVACARFSRPQNAPATVRVKMVGAVGEDFFGGQLLSSLEDDGIDVSNIQKVHGQSTGTANIIVEESTGENQILVFPGANHSLQPDMFRELPALKPALIVLQLEIPIETVVQVMRAAKQQKIPVLLNPAPVVALPEDIYQGLNHLVMNEGEADLLSQFERGDLPLHKHLGQVCGKFHLLGVLVVIITLGADGVFWSEGEHGRGHVSAAKVKEVVDTTAAGDTFVGAYAVEVVTSGGSVKDATTRANKAAARTVEKEGAQSSIPWRDEVHGSVSGG
ncbi:MAG: hypothetical protein Q9212_004857 [Teloschistes hypoglaucus]